ncbi:hypothetical protein P8452_02666 [Trifolium repens]|nr:hypothetical protein P8452_02666 [Trifolium repens]
MASTSSPRNVVPLAVDDKEPVIIDGSEFVSEISSIFPLHVTCEPKIFANSIFDMSFFEPGYRAFRSAPIVNESYLKWLNKVEK